MPLRDVPRQIEDVSAKEWLPTGDVHALRAESSRGIDCGDDAIGRHTNNPRRTGGDEAMRAREVACVVDLQPQLAQAVWLDVGRAAGVRLPLHRPVREHRSAKESSEEVV